MQAFQLLPEETHVNASIQMINEPGTDTARDARCIKASKKSPWEIDRDVLRGREFDWSNGSTARRCSTSRASTGSATRWRLRRSSVSAAKSSIARGMPGGYSTVAEPNAVASVVLSKHTWAVLALTCHIELFVQSHYEHSIDTDATLSPLFKDIFRFMS
jgi:hypothetical protein